MGVEAPPAKAGGAFGSEPGASRTIPPGLDFTIRPGEKVALIAGSGSGKMTLLQVLAGMTAPAEGHLHVDGHDIAHYAAGQPTDAVFARIRRPTAANAA